MTRIMERKVLGTGRLYCLFCHETTFVGKHIILSSKALENYK